MQESEEDDDVLAGFSESVRGVATDLGDGAVTAWQIAHVLFREHPAYGGAGLLPLADRRGRLAPVRRWLTDILHPAAWSLSVLPASDGLIHGRQVLLSLGLMEPELGSLLDASGVRARLRSDLAAGASDTEVVEAGDTIVLSPLDLPNAHAGRILALAVIDYEGSPLVISAGDDGAIKSWRLDGSPGPLAQPVAHPGSIWALAVVDYEGSPSVVSAGGDRAIKSWRLDGSSGQLDQPAAHAGRILALAVIDYEGSPLVISAGDDGAIKSWRLDGSPGPLDRPVAHAGRIRALAVIDYEGSPLVISAGGDRAIISWRPDGPGLLGKRTFHPDYVWALVVVDYEGSPLVIAAGDDGAIKSWRLDGTPGLFALPHAHAGSIWALAVVDYEGSPLVISAGDDGAIKSWRLDGTPGPLAQPDAHAGSIWALAVVSYEGSPLVVSAGTDGAILSWRVRDRLDAVELVGDRAASDDQLGRAPIAHDLARRLRRIHADPGYDGSFLVHLDGPWGSGKSSLLNFLTDDLAQRGPESARAEPPWLVVDFNAWRERRARPPWWALLTALRAAIRADLTWWGRQRLRFAETRQRLSSQGAAYGVATAVVGASIVALAVAWIVGLVPHDLQVVTGLLTAVVGAIGLIWGLGQLAGRFVFWDSARRARSFEQSEEQPMRRLADHFGWLTDAVASRRFEAVVDPRKPSDWRRWVDQSGSLRPAGNRATLILIDDLDRCDAEHVVELLEAVQNLIRDAGNRSNGPYFVVAADGRWIRRSYEACFERFRPAVGEPGRPLGYLFLDKLFQMSIEVPALTAADQDGFLGRLLGVEASEKKRPDVQPTAKRAAQSASLRGLRRQLAQAATEEEFAAVVQTAKSLPVAERRQVVAEVVQREGGEAQSKRTAHRLQPYAGHLPPNPRTMKRFVNAYEIARALDRVEGRNVRIEQRAIWTLVRLRWPLLADRLAEDPELLDRDVGGPKDEDGDEADVMALLRRHDVRSVLRRENGAFTAADVRACCGHAPAAPAGD